MTAGPFTEMAVCCVHSTRRTRQGAPAGVMEAPCNGCRATILVSGETFSYAIAHGVTTLHLLCPECTIAASAPDDRAHPHAAQLLHDAGIDPAAIADAEQRTIHDLAYTALRNTVGGQG